MKRLLRIFCLKKNEQCAIVLLLLALIASSLLRQHHKVHQLTLRTRSATPFPFISPNPAEEEAH